jgi:hypothetical protein
MATGLWKKKSSPLAVDVVSAMGSQRDGAAKAIYVSLVITTMHSGCHGMVTQQASKCFPIQLNRNCVLRHSFSP